MKYPQNTTFRIPGREWYWFVNATGDIEATNDKHTWKYITGLKHDQINTQDEKFVIYYPKEDLFDKLYERLI